MADDTDATQGAEGTFTPETPSVESAPSNIAYRASPMGGFEYAQTPPEQVIPTSVVSPDALPLEKATAARLEGYSWPEIDGHVANVRQTAEQFGYDQKAVDTQLGYKDPTPTLNNLTMDARANMASDTEGDPIEKASGGLFKQTDEGLIANPVTSTTRQDYADSINDGQIKSPQDFAQALTGAVSEAAGADAAGAIPHVAAQLPSPQEATDYAIGVADLTKPPDAPTVNATRTNMLDAWAETNEDLNTLYQASHANPLLQNALTTPPDPQERIPTVKTVLDGLNFLPMMDVARGFAKGITGDELATPKNLIQALSQIPEDLGHLAGKQVNDMGKMIADIMQPDFGTRLMAGDATADERMEMVGAALLGVGGDLIVHPTGTELLSHPSPYEPIGNRVLKDVTGELKPEPKEKPEPEEEKPTGVGPGHNMPPEALADWKAAEERLGKPLAGEKPPELPPPTNWTATRGNSWFAFSNLEDELNRMRTNDTATKKELLTMINTLPKEWRAEKFQEKVATEVEQRMVDPNYVHEPDVQAFLDHVKELTDKQYNLALEIDSKLPELKDTDASMRFSTTDMGYVHRITTDETIEAGGEKISPLTGRSLSKWAPGMQSRSANLTVFDHGNGLRNWNNDPHTYPLGTVGEDITGTGTWKVRPATMAEIEANTDLKYSKNFILNTAENYARLERINRNIDFLNGAMKEMEARGQFIRDNPKTGSMRPDNPNFVRVDLPGVLHGWAKPDVSYPLIDFFKPSTTPLLTKMQTANKFVIKSLYLTPVPHALNMGVNGIGGIGMDWVKPYRWGSMYKNYSRAAEMIANNDPKWLQSIREGASSPYASMQVQNFREVLHNAMTQEVARDPGIKALVKRLLVDTGHGTPSDFFNAWSNASQAMMWREGEILKFGRQLELEDQGMPTREAIFQAEKDNLNYRIPWQVMKSKVLSEWLGSTSWSLFGRYHFGNMRIIGSIADEIMNGVKSGTGTRADAVAKAIAYGLGTMAVTTVGWGISKGVNSAVQAVAPGTPNVNIGFGVKGAPALIDNAYKIVHGILSSDSLSTKQNEFIGGINNLVSVGPIIQTLLQGLTDHAAFGENPFNQRSGPAMKAAELTDWGLKQFPAMGWMMKMIDSKAVVNHDFAHAINLAGVGQVVSSLLGMKTLHPGDYPLGIPGQIAGEQPIPGATKPGANHWDIQQQNDATYQENNSFTGNIIRGITGQPPTPKVPYPRGRPSYRSKP